MVNIINYRKIIIAFMVILYSQTTNACSAFKLINNEKVYVAKNFDWHSSFGYMIKNNKGIKKHAYQCYEGNPAYWTSTYGSITFNQIGKEFPYGGMNEAGLVVEVLWLSDAQYNMDESSLDRISELEWVQYQLDKYASVDEVLLHLNELIVDPVYSKIHYFITDNSGKSVVIELIKGEIVITQNQEKYQVITNSTIRKSVIFSTKIKDQNIEIKPNYRSSYNRYCLLLDAVRNHKETTDFRQNELFELLETVTEDKEHYKSQWVYTYNLTDKTIQFRSYEQKSIKSINIKDINFEKDSPIVFFDLASEKTGNIQEKWETLTLSSNMRLINNSLKKLNFSFQYDQLNQHQISPIEHRIDTSFIYNHFDLEIVFNIKEVKGNVKFFVSNSKENFTRKIPVGGGEFTVTNHQEKGFVYSLPKGEYAVGSFQDINNNGRLDFSKLKLPKEPFAFSNNRKRFFFIPPSYKQSKFNLPQTKKVTIQLN